MRQGINSNRLHKLNVHMIDHTAERWLKCKQCFKGFKTTQAVQCHMKVHCDDKLFECKTCGKLFKTNNSLRKHTLIHNKDISLRSMNKNKTIRKHEVMTIKGERLDDSDEMFSQEEGELSGGLEEGELNMGT